MVREAGCCKWANRVDTVTWTARVGVGVGAAQLASVLYRTDFNSRKSCWDGFVGCGWTGFWIWMGALSDYIYVVYIKDDEVTDTAAAT